MSEQRATDPDIVIASSDSGGVHNEPVEQTSSIDIVRLCSDNFPIKLVLFFLFVYMLMMI